VAVMRKLAVALYHVGVRNEEFQPRRLFGRIGKHRGRGAQRAIAVAEPSNVQG